MSGAECSENEQYEPEDLKEVIREFLGHYSYLHEFRIQKLVYLLDLLSTLENNHRITDADFKPYMYGSYSEDIRDTLGELSSEIETELDLQHGEITTKYLGNSDGGAVRQETKELIERVVETADGEKNTDLGKWSKDTWLYKSTEYGRQMNFERLKSKRRDIIEDLGDQFPDLEISQTSVR